MRSLDNLTNRTYTLDMIETFQNLMSFIRPPLADTPGFSSREEASVPC